MQNRVHEPLTDIRMRNVLDFIYAAVETDVVLEVKPRDLLGDTNNTVACSSRWKMLGPLSGSSPQEVVKALGADPGKK